jgi:serine/threonine-protein kinase
MAATPPPIPRQRVGGKYELVELAGTGGMSTVWRALQHGPGKFRRTVAVKHMFPHLAEVELYREMFFEEARVGSVLQDPNIAQVYDFLVDHGHYYLVLEWVEGIDLFTYIDYVVNHEGRPTRWELMVAVGIGMLRGLAAAHERHDEDGNVEEIVHRDVTPHNILISTKGPAKLIDFGLSLAHDREGDSTEPGIAKGKTAYLAPEVVRGGRPTPHSDQFAAGCVLWEALVGRRLFGDTNPFDAMRRIAEGSVEPLRELRPDIPKKLVRVVDRALSVDDTKRFGSVREMAGRLGGVLRASTSTDDLYHALGSTVRAARVAMDMGRRSQGPRHETPIPDLSSGLIELPGADGKPRHGRGWLPNLLRRLRN